MRTVTVPVMVEVPEERVLECAAKEGIDYAVAAHRVASAALQVALANLEQPEQAAAAKSAKTKKA